jgi:S-formylglutathione hydrolase FrmB
MQRASREFVAYARYWGKLSRSRLRRHAPTILDVSPSPEDARAQRVMWFSPTLGTPKHLNLYLPPDYACSLARYPVLYLLRGHEREWLNTSEDGSRAGCNVIDVYEELLRSGEVGPMILAMPSMTSADGHVHGLGIDFLKPWLGTQREGVGTALWETYFREDVIDLIDAHWRTLPMAAHRGVDGFSLGGAMSLKFAAKFPGLFSTAGAYDGTFLYAEGSVVRGSDRLLGNPLWEPAFGRRRNLQYAAQNNVANLVLHADASHLRHITWMIQYGPEQVEPWGSNFYRGEHVIELLERRGVCNALPNSVLAGATHTWANADLHMQQTLPIHWQHLQPAY